jgi:hypothetical protein
MPPIAAIIVAVKVIVDNEKIISFLKSITELLPLLEWIRSVIKDENPKPVKVQQTDGNPANNA